MLNLQNQVLQLQDANGPEKGGRQALAPKREATNKAHNLEKKQKAEYAFPSQNSGPLASSGCPRATQGSSFSVFCDPQPQSSSHDYDSGISSQHTNISTTASITLASPLTRLSSLSSCVGKRTPLSAIPLDEITTEQDDSPMSIEDDNDDSVYESVGSTPSNYYTAPPDTDKDLHRDIVFCSVEYAKDIYLYLRKKEIKMRPKSHYMSKQSELNPKMRTILIDWLVDVAQEYSMGEVTVHLAVSYVDRYLSMRDVPRNKLQLVGTVSMMIASKYEEIYPPDVNEFVEVTDNTYTKQHVVKLERLMLQDMEFNLSGVTAYDFAELFLKKCRASQRTSNLARYLCELTLLDVCFLRSLPSKVGAAAVCLANLMTEYVAWPCELEEEMGISLGDIYQTMRQLHALALKMFLNDDDELSQTRAIFEKYADVRFLEVSRIEPPGELPDLDS